MKDLRKRDELPNFLKLPYTFDLDRICVVIDKAPESFEDLIDLNGYKKVGEACPCLEEIFGLKFQSIEDAYTYLKKTGIKPKNMKWDYRNFIKVSNGKIQLKNNPYKQMALTEYNSDFDSKNWTVKIPKNRLDERAYNKLKPWVVGTYIEKALAQFKGFITRVRVARMEPGCVIDEHIDYNTNYSIRIHIPLKTNDQCGFYIKRASHKDYITMPANGGCWFINQGYKHSAWNKGDKPRDHLVLSVVGQQDLYK